MYLSCKSAITILHLCLEHHQLQTSPVPKDQMSGQESVILTMHLDLGTQNVTWVFISVAPKPSRSKLGWLSKFPFVLTDVEPAFLVIQGVSSELNLSCGIERIPVYLSSDAGCGKPSNPRQDPPRHQIF